jgi:pimeloyl-ACP methyl ester carboxylesterase
MWGELDELVPKSSVKLVQKYFTNAQTITYNDVGHAMLMTNRGPALAKDIISFFNN